MSTWGFWLPPLWILQKLTRRLLELSIRPDTNDEFRQPQSHGNLANPNLASHEIGYFWTRMEPRSNLDIRMFHVHVDLKFFCHSVRSIKRQFIWSNCLNRMGVEITLETSLSPFLSGWSLGPRTPQREQNVMWKQTSSTDEPISLAVPADLGPINLLLRVLSSSRTDPQSH